MGKNKSTIYKNDLKFENFDMSISDFESEQVREIYNDYKSKPKIELRIKDSEMENYEYLDLSNLEIDDELLEELFSLKKIQSILKKIKFIDLSNNHLNTYPDLSEFPNIIYKSFSFNSIIGEINDNIVVELSCDYNKITKIKSKSLTKLNASNNYIEYLSVPNIKFLVINKNRLDTIDSYQDLEYLECIDNNIKSLNDLRSLTELYIASNELEILKYLPKMKVLNCTNNPIQKIGYFEKLGLLVCSTPKVSSKYTIKNLSKIKKDFMMNFEIAK
jgi:hypothetical protein